MMKLDFKFGWEKHHDLLESTPHRSEPEPYRLEPGLIGGMSTNTRHGAVATAISTITNAESSTVICGMSLTAGKNAIIEALNQSVSSMATSKALAQQNDTPANFAAASYESSASALQSDTPVYSTAKSYGRSAFAQRREGGRRKYPLCDW